MQPTKTEVKSGIPEEENVPFPLVAIVVLLYLQMRCAVVKERRTRDLVDSCLPSTIYQRKADRNRKLWNIVSTERSIHHMHDCVFYCMFTMGILKSSLSL